MQFLGSGSKSSSDTRAERLLLPSKVDDAKLEVTALRLTVMPKKLELKTMTGTILELEKRVAFLEI